MRVDAEICINGSRSAVWAAVTDIEHAAAIVPGIMKIELIERPARGLVGLRWRETRLLFGEPTTVEKWITEAADQEFYTTRAEDGGFAFVATVRLSGTDGRVTVTSAHDSTPLSLAAKVKALPMVLFKGTIRKALLKDLHDIKAAVERGATATA